MSSGWSRLSERMRLALRIDSQRVSLLLHAAKREQRQIDAGLREVDQPSQADFDIRRAAMRAEFTPTEREQIRQALGLDPLAGVWPVSGSTVSSPTESASQLEGAADAPTQIHTNRSTNDA